ncbi:MAG: alkaline phosphatase family protein [Kiritimatiellae bacterium]|nr:alkaline phosphatase family protein [Kiritimatiellia bacterium]
MSRKLLVLGIDGAADSVTRKLLARGKLPQLGRLVERGVYATATPSWPGETGANWATIATGASPAVHGCAYNVHLPGTPLDACVSGFPSTRCLAEPIWETAARHGKRSVIFNYPQSYPVTCDNVIHVGGDGCPDPDHTEIFAQQGYTTGEPPAATMCGNPVMTRIVPVPARGWAHVDSAGALAAPLEVRPGWKAMARLEPTAFQLLILPAKPDAPAEVLLCREQDAATALGRAQRGAWSGWMVTAVSTDRGAVEVAFRMKLLDLSDDGRRVHLYLTQGCPTTGYTTPEPLAAALNARCGYYRRRLVTQQWVLPNACDRQTFVEEAAYQADWYAKAAAYIFAEHDSDLFVLKWHGPDILHHHSWHLIDPIHPLHDPATRDEGWRLFESVYGIGDRMIGRIVESAGEDCIAAVVSDHGAYANILSADPVLYRELTRAGMIVHNADGTVNWRETQAYPGKGGVRVNLAGRDPGGCVSSRDYARVRGATIELMQDMRHPATREHLFSLVCVREDAAFMGFGGERAGDVFYCVKPLGIDGTAAAAFEGVAASPHMQGNTTGTHGACLPSTRFSEGSQEGIFIAGGQGLKRGLCRPNPISLADVAPTLCRLWGMASPRHAEGRVLEDLLA